MEVVNEFPDSQRAKHKESDKYNVMVDGRVYKLTRGVDFRGKLNNLRTKLWYVAARFGMKPKTTSRDKGDTLYVQFVPL